DSGEKFTLSTPNRDSNSDLSITKIPDKFDILAHMSPNVGPIETGQVIEVVSRAQDKTYFSELKQPNCPCHTISGNEYHSYTPEHINDDHESESRSQSLNTGKKDSPPHGSTNQSAQSDGKSNLTEVYIMRRRHQKAKSIVFTVKRNYILGVIVKIKRNTRLKDKERNPITTKRRYLWYCRIVKM
ncbi:unnamed protein product, partial [Timema podura]|nr:unnamed protein product [Timema podura]